MRQHSNLAKDTAEKVVKDIRRATRKQYSAEEKIRRPEAPSVLHGASIGIMGGGGRQLLNHFVERLRLVFGEGC